MLAFKGLKFTLLLFIFPSQIYPKQTSDTYIFSDDTKLFSKGMECSDKKWNKLFNMHLHFLNLNTCLITPAYI